MAAIWPPLLGIVMPENSSIFDTIDKELEAFDVNFQRRVLRHWQRSINKYVSKLAKDISPFKAISGANGKAIFRLYNQADSRSKEAQVSVWGNKPNIASDPSNYPRIPNAAFKFGQKRRITLTAYDGSKIFRYSEKAQEHYEHISPKPWPDIHESGSKAYYFTHNNLVWKHVYSRDKQRTFPVFSMNSIPKTVEQYTQFNDDIMDIFHEVLVKEMEKLK